MNKTSVIDRDIIKIFLSLIIVSTLILAGIGIQRDFTVVLDGEIIEASSTASTIGEALEDMGLKLEEKGYIDHSLDDKLKSGMEILVLTPKTYTIFADGEKRDVISPFMTVEEILNDQEIQLSDLDRVEPALEDEISKGGNIIVKRVTEELEEKTVAVDFDQDITENPDLPKGVENINVAGENGEKLQKIRHIYVDGQLEKTEVYEEEVIKEPVTQLVEKGTKTIVATSRGNANFSKVIIMNASAYDLSYHSTGKHPGDPYFGITASGTKAKRGTVAVDPRVIPLGTKLYIQSLDDTPDYGFATAEDTGGAIKGNKIDLLMDSRQECTQFGRRNVKVYILD